MPLSGHCTKLAQTAYSRVEMRHSRFALSGEVHPSKAVIIDLKPRHLALRLFQFRRW